MDFSAAAGGPEIDPSKLTPAEQRDLQQFAAAETQKTRLQSSIHHITHLCFKKCITSKISSGQLDKHEEPCLRDCVERFMDLNITVLNHLSTLKGGSS